jgi:hypothetical protein
MKADVRAGRGRNQRMIADPSAVRRHSRIGGFGHGELLIQVAAKIAIIADHMFPDAQAGLAMKQLCD